MPEFTNFYWEMAFRLHNWIGSNNKLLYITSIDIYSVGIECKQKLFQKKIITLILKSLKNGRFFEKSSQIRQLFVVLFSRVEMKIALEFE